MTLRRTPTRAARSYSVFAMVLAAWCVIGVIRLSAGDANGMAELGGLVAGAAMPMAANRFFAGFLDDRSAWFRRILVFQAVMAVTCVVAATSGIVVRSDIDLAGWAVMTGGLLLDLMVVWRNYRMETSAVEGSRMLYLLGTAGAAFSVATIDFMPGIGTGVYGNLAAVGLLYFLFQAAVRRRLLDLYELMGRVAVLVAMTLAVGMVYALLVVWWREDLEIFLFDTLVASMVVLILLDPARVYLEDRLTSLFYRGRRDLSGVVAEIAPRLKGVVEVQAAAETVMQGLESSGRVTSASFYLIDRDGLQMRLVRSTGPAGPMEFAVEDHRPLLGFAVERGVVVLEDLDEELQWLERLGGASAAREAERIKAVRPGMQGLSASVAISIAMGGHTRALLVLRDDRMRRPYSAKDLSALASLANQVQSVMESSAAFEQARERDRLALLGELAAGLAHEVRNPLGAIRGAADLLTAASSEDREFVAVIREEAERLNSVVRAFLDFARPLRPVLVPTDLSELARRGLAITGKDLPGDIRLSADVPPDPVMVSVDPDLVVQVLINLLQNAAQAMPQGGELTVTVRMGTRDVEPMASVVDTGVGMSEEVLARAFSPFFTTKPKGTGLGLPLCRRIVSAMGGGIEVRSKVGAGTRVDVYLPAVR